MGISYKDFKAGNFQGTRCNKIKEHPVLAFLRKNKNKKKCCFTIKEIMKSTKMREAAVRGAVRKLKKKGLIEHKQPYFVFK